MGIRQHENAYKVFYNVETKKLLVCAMKEIGFRWEKYMDGIQIHVARVICFDSE